MEQLEESIGRLTERIGSRLQYLRAQVIECVTAPLQTQAAHLPPVPNFAAQAVPEVGGPAPREGAP